mgnify:CR=1 FL=1
MRAQHGGTFILRIEDTDVERSTPEAVQAILDSDGVARARLRRGPVLPDAADGPLSRGDRATCSTRGTRLPLLHDAARSSTRCAPAQMARGEKPRYDGRWRPENAPARSPPPGVRAGRSASSNPARRRRSPGTTRVKGRIEIANAELDDLVIARAGRHADLQLLRRRRRHRHAHHARDPRRRPRQQHAAADQHPPRAGRARCRVYAHVPTVLGRGRAQACRSATARWA